MRRHLVALALSSALAGSFVGGCGGENPGSGLSAYLRVANAQLEPGELGMAADATAPTIDSVKINSSHVQPGAQNRSITGSLTGTAVALLIGLSGDGAHWLGPVGGVPDLEIPGNATFSVSLSFSPTLPFGERNLLFRAVDRDGVVGPAQILKLKIDDPTPKAALLVDLTWDTQADLDLHLHVTPTDPMVKPYDIWAKAPATPVPSGTTAKPDGALSFDSNARCTLDGLRLERAVFETSYPVGHYEVRVDTFSLCGEATARWHAKAYTNPAGTPATIVESYGQSIDRDTLGAHNAAAGLLAMTFDISP
jgi:hypothetical protein